MYLKHLLPFWSITGYSGDIMSRHSTFAFRYQALAVVVGGKVEHVHADLDSVHSQRCQLPRDTRYMYLEPFPMLCSRVDNLTTCLEDYTFTLFPDP